HNAPRIREKIQLIKKKYGFHSRDKKIDSSKKFSISIYYDDKEDGAKRDRRKLKLHWFEKEGVWKVTNCVRGQRRLAILDVLSGSDAPDFRFLLKTCHNQPVNEKHEKVFADLQRDGLQLRDGMWFRMDDFKGKINVESIKQTIKKKRYINDKFQLSFLSVLDATNKKVIKEDTINLKNLYWKTFEETVGSDISEKPGIGVGPDKKSYPDPISNPVLRFEFFEQRPSSIHAGL
ncbi:8464_t:CDS:2, partial [Ambispora leptoticha]